MKNHLRRDWILSLTIFLLALSGNCQAGFKFSPGYIVLNTMDTLRGELSVQSECSNSKSCIFRKTSKTSISVFKPFEIKGFTYLSGNKYSSFVLPESGDSVFLRFVLNGVVDLYSREDYMSNSYYYLKKDTLPLVILNYFEQPVATFYKDTNRIVTNYKTTIYKYVEDCPSIKGQVRLMKNPNYPELHRLLQRYQKLMSPTEPLLVYKNRTKKHPYVELGYGWTFPEHYSVNFFLPLPLLPNFTYVGIGYDSFYGIPLQFKVRFPIAFVQPEFGVGVNLNPSLPFGVMYRWSGGVNLSAGRYSIGCKYTYHNTYWFPKIEIEDLSLSISYQFR